MSYIFWHKTSRAFTHKTNSSITQSINYSISQSIHQYLDSFLCPSIPYNPPLISRINMIVCWCSSLTYHEISVCRWSYILINRWSDTRLPAFRPVSQLRVQPGNEIVNQVNLNARRWMKESIEILFLSFFFHRHDLFYH